MNIWGLVAVIVFYLVILLLGIIAGRRAKHSEKNANSEEIMLAGRNIGKVTAAVNFIDHMDEINQNTTSPTNM